MLTIYLVCFLFGLGMTLLAFLSGAAHADLLPKLHLHDFHFHGHATPHLHVPHVDTHVDAGRGGASLTHVSFFNFAALMAFLTWFGGCGYLLSRFATVSSIVALTLSILGGVIGASAINFFLVKVLIGRERSLEPAQMIGTIGVLTIPLREQGTSEIVYSQHGTRRSAAARTDDGAPLSKGAEVVITRYENGIAYVRPVEDVLDQAPSH
jgi:membrane protein implicated in regulation of membrane protease activity